MRFANPAFLWLLAGVPGLLLFLWWRSLRRVRMMERFASPAVLGYLAPHHSRGRYLLRQGLVTASVIGVVFAGARPQWGYEDRRIISRGIDLIVAIDTSASMLAQDYKPNRMQRARELLQNILWKARGDRVGVMAFAGEAIIQCPLTLDYSMARTALESIDAGSVPFAGTAIGTAIDTAVKAFENASTGERVLVLLTDGEDHENRVLDAAARAAHSRITIHTIGIGTTQGMPIPLPGGSYKQDKSGKLVSSKLDFLTLSKIAQATGGKAIKANAEGATELEPIMHDIDSLQKTQQQDTLHRVYTERFQWFLLPAILFLLWEALETCYSRRGRTWKGRVVEA